MCRPGGGGDQIAIDVGVVEARRRFDPFRAGGLDFGTHCRIRRDRAASERFAIDEQLHSLSKTRYAALFHKYCPEIDASELLPHPSGVRAVARRRRLARIDLETLRRAVTFVGRDDLAATG